MPLCLNFFTLFNFSLLITLELAAYLCPTIYIFSSFRRALSSFDLIKFLKGRAFKTIEYSTFTHITRILLYVNNRIN